MKTCELVTSESPTGLKETEAFEIKAIDKGRQACHSPWPHHSVLEMRLSC